MLEPLMLAWAAVGLSGLGFGLTGIWLARRRIERVSAPVAGYEDLLNAA